jgi:hypothetical protein
MKVDLTLVGFICPEVAGGRVVHENVPENIFVMSRPCFNYYYVISYLPEYKTRVFNYFII